MEKDWFLIKKDILKDCEEIFIKEGILNSNETLDIFFNILENKKMNEIRNSLLFPMENYTGLDLKNVRFVLASKFESYLKTIYEILKINVEGELKKCLLNFFTRFNFLQINEKSIPFKNKDSYKFFEKEEITLVSIYSPDYFKNKMPFGYELKLSYDLRNALIHKGKLFGGAEPNLNNLPNEVRAILYSMLFITSKFLPLINDELNKKSMGNYSSYINSMQSSFKKWQKRFVHIEGKESFENIVIYVKEHAGKKNRFGNIDDIRNQVFERRMVILGEAGSGKSTTLQYMVYKDSKNILENNLEFSETNPLPIYIELKLIPDAIDLEDYLHNKIAIFNVNLTKAEFLDYLKDGKIELFFDGLNEILNNIKQKIFIELQLFIEKYPKAFIVLSSRPSDYNNDFKNLPVFYLQKMNDNQIIEFLQKNANNDFAKNQILNEIKNNSKLKKIISTPLLLFMLINIVEQNFDKMPETETLIIHGFIFNLYRWQQSQEKTFNIEAVHLLIRYLAIKSFEKGQNATFSHNEALKYMKERKTELGINIDILDTLKRATELNILSMENNLYSFSHQKFQEYYVQEELEID